MPLLGNFVIIVDSRKIIQYKEKEEGLHRCDGLQEDVVVDADELYEGTWARNSLLE